MPRVPTYQDQVETQRLPSARFTADAPVQAFGGGPEFARASQQFQNLAETVKNKYEEYQLQADKDRVRSGLYEFQRQSDTIESKYKNRKLKEAVNSAAEFEQEYSTLYQQFEDSFANDRQKGLFKQSIDPIKLGSMRRVNRHELAESEKFRVQSYEANLEALRKSAIDNYMDVDSVLESITLQQKEYRDFNESKVGEQELQLGLREIENKTFTGVIGRMMNSGQGVMAKAYFESIKDQLDGETASKLAKAVDIASREDIAELTAKQLFAESGEDYGAALDKLRKKKGMAADVLDETRKRLGYMAKDKKIAEEASLEKELEQYRDILFQNGGRMDALPKERLVALPDKAVAALERRAQNIRDGRNVSDPQAVRDWLSMAPEELADLDSVAVNEYLSRLSDQDEKRFLKDVSAAKNGKIGDIADGRTRNQILKEAHKLAGIGNDAEAITEFNEIWSQEIALETEKKGRLSKIDLDKIKNRLVAKFDTSFFGSTRGYELSTDDLIEASKRTDDQVERDYLKELSFNQFYRSIDKNVRARLVRDLRRKNIPVTNETIRGYYEIYMKRQAAK